MPENAQQIKIHAVAEIEVAAIKDGGAQMRIEMRPETVLDYAEEMLGGATFPPVVVFFDGTDYWLGDGFHRHAAAKKIERATIAAEVREGTARDAVLYGVGANATHGLRRTQADKRRAVERLVTDPEWAQWSDRQIAKVAKVDHKTVAKIRRELAGEITKPAASPGEIPKRDGMPKANGSLVATMLASLSDDALIAECRRRGLEVSAHA
jgi:hypothetical protein